MKCGINEITNQKKINKGSGRDHKIMKTNLSRISYPETESGGGKGSYVFVA